MAGKKAEDLRLKDGNLKAGTLRNLETRRKRNASKARGVESGILRR
jgi:hypothetical protein